MSQTTPYFLYARKSTKGEERQALSIERQLDELRQLIRREGLSVVAEFIETESAKRPGRPIFDDMLRRVEAGEASGIVTWHSNRLARNSVDGGRILDLLDRGMLTDIKFPTARFENTPHGKFMLLMAFAESKHYVDALSVSTKSGLDHKARKGEFPGMAPIGYLNDRRIKRIVPDPERAPVIRALFKRYATGNETYDTLREFLAERGILSRKENRKLIERDRIAMILSNPVYYGDFKWGGEIYGGTHKPIVSRQLFDRVQELRGVRSRWSQKKSEQKPMAFRRLLTCGECGCAVTAETQKGHVYYRCTKKAKKGAQRCSQPYVREEALDAQITSLLSPYALRDDWAERMLALIESERIDAGKESVALIAENRRRIEELNASLRRLQELLVDGLVEHQFAREKRIVILRERRAFEARIAALTKDAGAWLEPFREWVLTAQTLGKTTEPVPLMEKGGIAGRIFGSNLVLEGKKASGKAVKPWAFIADNQLSHDVVRLYHAARTFFRENHTP